MDDAPFTMFVGDRDPDVQISAARPNHVHLSVGDGYLFLAAAQALEVADGLVSAAVKADPEAARVAIQAKMRQISRELMELGL